MDLRIGPNSWMTTGDFDPDKYPIPPTPIEPSRTECRHTPVPASYHSWYEWCEQASKTCRCVRCPRCGLFKIWMLKADAKAYEKRQREEANRASERVKAEALKRYHERRKAGGA